MDIRELLARRTDLSTFLVHLTRDTPEGTARQALESILTYSTIEARSMFGAARGRLEKLGLMLDSQKCVCFTETPLEFAHLLLSELPNRDCTFRPYGVAITKMAARKGGVNPVWYVDITPGHDWITNEINALIDPAIDTGTFIGHPIEKIAPFVEQMGTQYDPWGNLKYRKEFWWEREWRCRGNFTLTSRVIGLCPEEEIPYFTKNYPGMNMRYIDPRWGLERIIAHLAGYHRDDVELP